MLTAHKGETIEVNGIKTYYIKTGSGVPLILIHGASPGACSLVNWGLNIEPLAAARFTVIAYDQPGFGYSDQPKDYSLEYRVAHAKSFIEGLGLHEFYVMGNSQGAYIAARIALEDPRTKKLVLVSSGTLAPPGSAASQALSKEHSEKLRQYTPSLENSRRLTLGTLFHEELVTDELVQLRHEMSIGKNLAAGTERRKAPSARPLRDEMHNLKVKTLILWGKNDGGASVERGLALFQSIAGAEFHVFDECAHWVQWDQADRFHKLVIDFLSG